MNVLDILPTLVQLFTLVYNTNGDGFPIIQPMLSFAWWLGSLVIIHTCLAFIKLALHLFVIIKHCSTFITKHAVKVLITISQHVVIATVIIIKHTIRAACSLPRYLSESITEIRQFSYYIYRHRANQKSDISIQEDRTTTSK